MDEMDSLILRENVGKSGKVEHEGTEADVNP